MAILSFSLIFALITIGFSKLSNKIDLMPFNIGYWYFFIFIWFITVFRYNVGYDYPIYYEYLINYQNNWAIKKFELIPRIILKVALYLHSPLFFFICINTIILFLFFKSIYEDAEYKFFSLLIFLTLFYLTSLSAIRQWLALSIIFYSYKYIKKKELLKYFICIIIAGNCHTTAFIAIVLYFLFNYTKNVKFVALLEVSLIFLIKLIFPIVLKIFPLFKYINYLNNTSLNNNGAGKIVYIYYLIIVFQVILLFKKKTIDEEIKKLIIITLFGLQFTFILGTSTGLRLGYYFYIFLIYTLPSLICEIKEFNKNKYLAYIPFMLYYFLFLYIDSKNNSGYSHYTLYFFKDGF